MRPFDALKQEKLKSKETIVHCCHIFIILESASLCHLEHIVFFPSLLLICELAIERWRVEVVEAQVDDSVSLVHRIVDTVCHNCTSNLLIEIYFPIQFMCILNMNIQSMGLFNFLYIIEHIC